MTEEANPFDNKQEQLLIDIWEHMESGRLIRKPQDDSWNWIQDAMPLISTLNKLADVVQEIRRKRFAYGEKLLLKDSPK